MTALTRAELALLDFLCGAHHQRCRVTRLRYPWSVQAENLQSAGLVEPDSFIPTAWAMHDWRTRQAFPAFNETTVSAPASEPLEPPAPRAADEGGGAARWADAPSPERKLPELPRQRGKRDNRGASGAHGGGRERAPESGLANGPIQQRRRRTPDTAASTLPVDIKVNAVTGVDLLAEIEPYLARTGLNRTEFSLRVFGYPGALSDLSGRRRQIPKHGTIEKVRRFIADNPDLRVEHEPKGEITGDQLADELDAFIAKHGLGRTRVAKAALGHSSGIASLRRFKFPAARTIERVRAFLADPGPLEDLKPGKRQPQSRRNPDAETLRRQRAINSVSRAQAMKRIEEGLPVGDVRDVPVRVRVAQIQLQEELKEQARLACPVEQAKTILRRRYAPVVGAEVVGGAKGKFVVGRKTVSKSELLEMAEGMRP